MPWNVTVGNTLLREHDLIFTVIIDQDYALSAEYFNA